MDFWWCTKIPIIQSIKDVKNLGNDGRRNRTHFPSGVLSSQCEEGNRSVIQLTMSMSQENLKQSESSSTDLGGKGGHTKVMLTPQW